MENYDILPIETILIIYEQEMLGRNHVILNENELKDKIDGGAL